MPVPLTSTAGPPTSTSVIFPYDFSIGRSVLSNFSNSTIHSSDFGIDVRDVGSATVLDEDRNGSHVNFGVSMHGGSVDAVESHRQQDSHAVDLENLVDHAVENNEVNLDGVELNRQQENNNGVSVNNGVSFEVILQDDDELNSHAMGSHAVDLENLVDHAVENNAVNLEDGVESNSATDQQGVGSHNVVNDHVQHTDTSALTISDLNALEFGGIDFGNSLPQELDFI
uniref:uncharacterized protein LOC105351711 n=1 Tax=Fragaria vesca subsp. vesca TaxID=101020 RepID=UPI0005CAFEAE|nr:PREDICTED: uncharacterized protein LOC105351711 [Fragaria vesca subsp. vesca]